MKLLQWIIEIIRDARRLSRLANEKEGFDK